ncbi:TetR/AcrR family transcriptional regulator [Streptomyces sp. BI20]|uniref:TetR/AcrR family transcriptional regulator n=1 Tax=Streptomyces sp. BI20 TaxID=3403460 RepID=UPI003C787DE6
MTTSDENAGAAEGSLRETKKARTRARLASTALELFLERGFAEVSVADVARAAEVSKPTLFRYFPTKEDLVLDRFADHQDEAARLVRERPAGQDPVTALRLAHRAGLDARDPITGLCDHPGVLAYMELLHATPELAEGMARYTTREVDLLADALGAEGADPLVARLGALHLITTRHELGRAAWELIRAGRTADEAAPLAHAAADRAFDLLACGLTPALTPSALTAAARP